MLHLIGQNWIKTTILTIRAKGKLDHHDWLKVTMLTLPESWPVQVGERVEIPMQGRWLHL